MLLGIEFPNFKLSMLAIFKTSPYHLCLMGPGKHLYAFCCDNCSSYYSVYILLENYEFYSGSGGVVGNSSKRRVKRKNSMYTE